MTQTDFL